MGNKLPKINGPALLLAFALLPSSAGAVEAEARIAVAALPAQQRAEAELRAQLWAWFGPRPWTARLDEVQRWLDERR
jgi:hypothetical protein